MRTNAIARVSAVLVGLEGLSIAGLVVWQIVAMLQGDTDSLASALALAVLTAVGAVAVLAFAAAVWRGQSWGRSGSIVTQLLILAVALGAATGAYAEPAVAAVLAVPAIVTLVLLILAARRAGREARGDASA
jgi:hypothetical protein